MAPIELALGIRYSDNEAFHPHVFHTQGSPLLWNKKEGEDELMHKLIYWNAKKLEKFISDSFLQCLALSVKHLLQIRGTAYCEKTLCTPVSKQTHSSPLQGFKRKSRARCEWPRPGAQTQVPPIIMFQKGHSFIKFIH